MYFIYSLYYILHVVTNLHKLYGILVWGNTCKPHIAAENGPLEQFHFSTTRVTQALCLCCLTALVSVKVVALVQGVRPFSVKISGLVCVLSRLILHSTKTARYSVII